MKLKYVTLASLAASLIMVGCNKPNDDNTTPANPPTAGSTSTMGTTTGEELKKEMGEAATATKEYLADGKDAFVVAMQERLAQLDKKIDDLKSQSAATTPEASAERSKLLASLSEKRQQLGVKYDQVKNASKDAWQEAKNGLDAALVEFEKSYEEIKAKFTN